MKCRAAFVAAVVLAGLAPGSASAHANLVRSVPASGQRVAPAPRRVLVVFDDPVQVGPGNEVVRNGGGSVLAAPPRADGRMLVLPLRTRGLTVGTYTVRWSIISDDGHNELGVFSFAFGMAPVAAPSLTAAEHLRVAVVLARWFFLSSLLLAAGLALFEVLVARATLGRPTAQPLVGASLAGVAAGAAILINLTGGGVSTRFGLACLIAAIVAAGGVLAGLSARLSRRSDSLSLIAAIALLPIPTVAGHTLDAGESWVQVPIDLLHVVPAAFWIGSVVAIALAAPRHPTVVRRATIARFSRFALPAVALIALSGLFRALSELRHPSQLWTTSYGATLIAKSALLAISLALASYARSGERTQTFRLWPVRSEAVALTLVLVAVGLLTSLPPARTRTPATTAAQREGAQALPSLPAADAIVAGTRDDGFVAALAVRPTHEAQATFIAQDGKAVDVGPVQINGAPTRSCGIGCYLGTAQPHGLVIVSHGSRSLRFDLGQPEPAPKLVETVTSAYSAVHGLVYRQRIASGLGTQVDAMWRENRHGFSYQLANGAKAIVIGSTRWDRHPGGRWTRSKSHGSLAIVPPWGTTGPFRNIHILRRNRTRITFSFLGANIFYPAWFTVVADTRTKQLIRVRMSAAAHFMKARYLTWDEPVVIRPPHS